MYQVIRPACPVGDTGGLYNSDKQINEFTSLKSMMILSAILTIFNLGLGWQWEDNCEGEPECTIYIVTAGEETFAHATDLHYQSNNSATQLPMQYPVIAIYRSSEGISHSLFCSMCIATTTILIVKFGWHFLVQSVAECWYHGTLLSLQHCDTYNGDAAACSAAAPVAEGHCSCQRSNKWPWLPR